MLAAEIDIGTSDNQSQSQSQSSFYCPVQDIDAQYSVEIQYIYYGENIER